MTLVSEHLGDEDEEEEGVEEEDLLEDPEEEDPAEIMPVTEATHRDHHTLKFLSREDVHAVAATSKQGHRACA